MPEETTMISRTPTSSVVTEIEEIARSVNAAAIDRAMTVAGDIHDDPSHTFSIPVMFDVTGPSRGVAAADLVALLEHANLPDISGRGLSRPPVESWWLIEAQDKDIDGNDNAAGRVVFDVDDGPALMPRRDTQPPDLLWEEAIRGRADTQPAADHAPVDVAALRQTTVLADRVAITVPRALLVQLGVHAMARATTVMAGAPSQLHVAADWLDLARECLAAERRP